VSYKLANVSKEPNASLFRVLNLLLYPESRTLKTEAADSLTNVSINFTRPSDVKSQNTVLLMQRHLTTWRQIRRLFHTNNFRFTKTSTTADRLRDILKQWVAEPSGGDDRHSYIRS